MRPIPRNILAQFNDCLKQRNVPLALRADYRKWLLFFLDFRAKYPPSDSTVDQVKRFVDKLRSKNQTAWQVEQAADAISLLFASQPVSKIGASPVPRLAPNATRPRDRQLESKDGADRNSTAPQKLSPMVCEPPGGYQLAPPVRGGKRYDEWRCLRQTEAPAWDSVIEKLAREITVRHYSRKTLMHYANWSRKFQSYLKDKDPGELSSEDVKNYLTYLAVDCKVSSSHQNLAFNALLFLYRHVLNKDFGIHKDIPRAKTSNYIPTVPHPCLSPCLCTLPNPFTLPYNPSHR